MSKKHTGGDAKYGEDWSTQGFIQEENLSLSCMHPSVLHPSGYYASSPACFLNKNHGQSLCFCFFLILFQVYGKLELVKKNVSKTTLRVQQKKSNFQQFYVSQLRGKNVSKTTLRLHQKVSAMSQLRENTYGKLVYLRQCS